MQLSLSSHLLVYGQCCPEELVTAREAGLAQLELWLAEPHVPWRDLGACRALRSQLEDLGFEVASVHLPFYPSVPALLDRGEKWSLLDPDASARQIALDGSLAGLEAAEALGAAHAVLHLGWQRDCWGDAENHWAREAVSHLLQQSRSSGPSLLLENIISSGTRAASLVALLDELDPEQRAGICLDLGHAHVDGGVLAELRTALPRLRHLHLHDNDGCTDAHLAPGAGTIPWPQVLAELDQAGFQGCGALEVRDYSRGQRPAREVVQETLDASRLVFPELVS